MKNFITLLLVLFVFGATAQNIQGKSNMVIMDNSGDPFYVIIDNVVQNVFPSYQLKIVGMPAKFHDIQLLYLNGNMINLREQITLQPFKQYTGFVNWNNNQKRLNWIEVTGINQSNYGNNIDVIMYASYNNQGGNNPGGNFPPNGNQNPNGNYNPDCNFPLATIQPILDEMDNINFAAKKLEYAMDALRNKCITSDQAYQIVEAFNFDSDRVKIAKYCYDRMTDQLYANKLLDLFPYSTTRAEVRKYFTK